MRKKRRRDYRKLVDCEIDLLPMMNVFIVLIPMLLTSAVFLKVTVIDTNVPTGAAAENPSEETEDLALAVTIKGDYYIVEGRGIEKQVIARAAQDADDQLALALAGVVTQHPDNQDVMIISQPKTHYREIIAVMDIARATGLPSASLIGAE